MGPGVRVAPEGRGSATGRLLMCSQEPFSQSGRSWSAVTGVKGGKDRKTEGMGLVCEMRTDGTTA